MTRPPGLRGFRRSGYREVVTDYDPRIVDLYDEDNPDGPDHDFYRSLVKEREAQTILDLGCGTGLLTVTLARDSRKVIGIDPSSAMISFARDRPGANQVTWIEGDSSSVPDEQFDFAIMTGNVAQHIQDSDWMSTLHDLRRCMQVDSTLAFESRNPTARAWEEWQSDDRGAGRPNTARSKNGWTSNSSMTEP